MSITAIPYQSAPNAALAAKSTAPVDQADARAPAQNSKQDDDDFSFWDLLDVVNPLQHIPIISSVYREITGDTIKPVAEVAGGALFGGVIGMAASVANVVFEKVAGEDPVMLAYNTVTGNDDDSAPVALAKNDPAPSPVQLASAKPAVASDNQSALLQLASDLHAQNADAAGASLPGANNAAKTSDFVKSLQNATPFNAVMPPPATQFMKPSLTNNMNALANTHVNKAGEPVIEIRPMRPAAVTAPDAANDAAQTGSAVPQNNKQIADKMMQALDAYQKMHSATSDALAPANVSNF